MCIISFVTPPVTDTTSNIGYEDIMLFLLCFTVFFVIPGIIKFFYRHYKLYTNIFFLKDEIVNLKTVIKLLSDKLDNLNNNSIDNNKKE